MKALIEGTAKLLQLAVFLFTFFRAEVLRREGERREQLKAVNQAYEQRGEAHEIDVRVARDGITDAELERMRKYERKDGSH